MKKILLALTLTLLTAPAIAQQEAASPVAAPPPAAADGTVRQGPLFLGGFVERIKENFARKPADPVLQARETAPAPIAAASSQSKAAAAKMKAQRAAQQAAIQNHNRQVAAAISAAADRDFALIVQEVEREKALQAARAAGAAVPATQARQAGAAAPAAPVRVIDGTPKAPQGSKPIFNNYR